MEENYVHEKLLEKIDGLEKENNELYDYNKVLEREIERIKDRADYGRLSSPWHQLWPWVVCKDDALSNMPF